MSAPNSPPSATSLPALARSLHASGTGKSPQQIRSHYRFLNADGEPQFSEDEVRSWLTVSPATSALHFPAAAVSQGLTGSDATKRQHAHDEIGQVFTASAREAQQLREQVARLEAQTRVAQATIEQQASALAARSPSRSPARSSAGSSRPSSPRSGRGSITAQAHEEQLAVMNKLAQSVEVLAQMNAQLMARLEHATQPSVTPVATSAPVKPFKDILGSQLAPFRGDGKVTPEEFLTQFRLLARQYTLSREERVRQLSAKLADDALKWFNITFGGTSDAATESELALGLRKQFGVEYEGARALRATFMFQGHEAQAGTARVMAIQQLLARARQLRVPTDVGQWELHFARLLAAFAPSELNTFFGELTKDEQCSETTLRLLEEQEDMAASGGTDPESARDSSLFSTTPARERIFRRRVELAEAALRRIQARPSVPPRARLSLAAGEVQPAPTPPAPHVPPTTPPTLPAEPSAMCLVLQERVDALSGSFHGPPHYFCTNTKHKTKNAQEFERRSKGGYCFKCTMSQLEEVPFLNCRYHGPTAEGTAPSVRRDRRA